MSGTGDHVLSSVLVTLWPHAHPVAAGTVACARTMMAQTARFHRFLFSLALFSVAVCPPFLAGRPRLFHHLDEGRRASILARWASTRLVPPRALLMTVRAPLAMAYYDQPGAPRRPAWEPAMSGYGGGSHA